MRRGKRERWIHHYKMSYSRGLFTSCKENSLWWSEQRKISRSFSLLFLLFFPPLTRFYSVAQVSLEFTAVPLPQSSKCWVCRCEPSQLAGSLPFCLIQCVIYKISCHILVHFRFHITYFISQVPFLPLPFWKTKRSQVPLMLAVILSFSLVVVCFHLVASFFLWTLSAELFLGCKMPAWTLILVYSSNELPIAGHVY